MRIATVWACVALSSVPASAGDHIYLSCVPHSLETTTKFANGRMETEKELPLKVSFEIDVDLEHRFINGVNLPLDQSSALLFRGSDTFVAGSKYRSSWSTSMTIDRLTGWASLSATWAMPRACRDEWKGNKGACKEASSVTVYQCEPGSLRSDVTNAQPRRTSSWPRDRRRISAGAEIREWR